MLIILTVVSGVVVSAWLVALTEGLSSMVVVALLDRTSMDDEFSNEFESETVGNSVTDTTVSCVVEGETRVMVAIADIREVAAEEFTD